MSRIWIAYIISGVVWYIGNDSIPEYWFTKLEINVSLTFLIFGFIKFWDSWHFHRRMKEEEEPIKPAVPTGVADMINERELV